MFHQSKSLIVVTLVAPVMLAGATISAASSGAVAESGWEWVNPRPQGHNLRAAVADNGVTVAVGSNGSIIASDNGIRWKVCGGSVEYNLSDVIWANGQFVAVGGKAGEEFRPLLGVVLTSSDGFHWVERHRVDYFWIKSVVWDGGRFVAVGKGASVLISTDGVTWMEIELELEIWDLEDVIWDGSRFVAVGEAYGQWSSYFTSDDALNWEESPFDCSCNPAAIAWGRGRYVVVGAVSRRTACVLTSTDASTWEEQSWEQTRSLADVVHGDSDFVAVGDSGFVATSPDGYIWTYDDPPLEMALLAVADTGGGYLAVGEAGVMLNSLDGTVWEDNSSDSLELPGFYEVYEIAAADGVLIGVGTKSAIIRSKYGRAWRRRPAWGIGDYNSVRRFGSHFWAVGDFGIVRSQDGLEWELMLYDTEARLFDIAWNGSIFLAVGWNPAPGQDQALLATSLDGESWTYQWIETDAKPQAVTWTGSRFVVVGANGADMTSPDGYIWEQHHLSDQISLRDVEWNGERLVAVGDHWETGRLLLSSIDGLQWEECLPHDVHGTTFSDVMWTGSRFLAVGRPLGDTIYSSTDGVNWSTETTGTGLNPVSVGGDEDALYLIGLGGKIIRRIDPNYLAPPLSSGGRVVPSSVNQKRRLEADPEPHDATGRVTP